METEHIDAVWVGKQGEVTVEVLSRASGMAEADLHELVGYGALVPLNPAEAAWRFAPHCVPAVKVAFRLRRDFELDLAALALAMTLTGRIQQLETELRQLRVLIPHRSA